MYSTVIRYVFPVLFVATLLLGGLFHFLGIWRVEGSERRDLTDMPAWDAAQPDAYLQQVERYFNDHFPGRGWWLDMHAKLNYHIFKKSTLPRRVVVGRDGWLYKGGLQMDIYRGKFKFTPDQLARIAADLAHRRDSVQARNGRYYLAIAPLKARIYPEYLPPGVRPLNREGATEQLVRYLRDNEPIEVIDLHQPLLAWKARHPDTLLYYRTDHHWTRVAGLLAARVIVERLRQDFPALDSLHWADYYFTYDDRPGMTLADMLGLSEQMPERVAVLNPRFAWRAQPRPRPDYAPPAGFYLPEAYVVDQRSGRPHLPDLFVTRESFGGDLLQPLAEHFDRSFFFFDNWQHGFNGPVYYREGGDIYLQLIWEGMIYKLLETEPVDADW